MNKIYGEGIGRWIEYCCIAVLIIVLIYTLFMYSTMPNTVPIHFNAVGEADGFGSKITVLVMLPIILIMYGGLSFVQNKPDANNYIITITQANRDRQYRMVKNFVRILKLEVLLIFAYLQCSIIQGAHGRFSLGIWFLPTALIATFGTIAIYIYFSARAK